VVSRRGSHLGGADRRLQDLGIQLPAAPTPFGTYVETVLLTTNGTVGSPVVFQSENKWGARIAPTDTSGNLDYTVNIGGNYTTFQNFDITGTATTAAGIKCNGAPHCSVLNNRVHDIGNSNSVCTSGGAIVIGTGADNAIVNANQIYNIGPNRLASFRCNQQHGIY